MLHIQRTSLDLPSLLQSPDYSALIHPFVLSRLRSPSPDTHWVAVEARWEGELAGLSLSEVYPIQHAALSDSLVIHPSHRGRGIGRQLFAFTEDLLVQEERVGKIDVRYEQTDPLAPALEKILASLGWPPAKMFLIRCHFDVQTFDTPWIHHTSRLPPSMSIFTWKDLKPEERKQIEHWGEQGRFLAYLSPFREETNISKETSVGLRQDGLVIGWCITRWLSPSTICFYSLFIDRSFFHSGLGIQLLNESIRRVKQLPIPDAVLEINLMEIDLSWWRFVKKRLIPIAKRVERIKKSVRVFAIFLD